MANWYNFEDGVKVTDDRINRWIREIRPKVNSNYISSYISSGDTMVFAYFSKESVKIVVSTSEGYQNIEAPHGDTIPEYKRNSPFSYGF